MHEYMRTPVLMHCKYCKTTLRPGQWGVAGRQSGWAWGVVKIEKQFFKSLVFFFHWYFVGRRQLIDIQTQLATRTALASLNAGGRRWAMERWGNGAGLRAVGVCRLTAPGISHVQCKRNGRKKKPHDAAEREETTSNIQGIERERENCREREVLTHTHTGMAITRQTEYCRAPMHKKLYPLTSLPPYLYSD